MYSPWSLGSPQEQNLAVQDWEELRNLAEASGCPQERERQGEPGKVPPTPFCDLPFAVFRRVLVTSRRLPPGSVCDGDGAVETVRRRAGDVRVRAAWGEQQQWPDPGAVPLARSWGRRVPGRWEASSALGNRAPCWGRGIAFLLHLTDRGLIHRASPGHFPFLAAGPLVSLLGPAPVVGDRTRRFRSWVPTGFSVLKCGRKCSVFPPQFFG